jgi:hypothetical protein
VTYPPFSEQGYDTDEIDAIVAHNRAQNGKVCERCGQLFNADSRRLQSKRFCSRRCQNNAYHAQRLRADAAFHARALEYQRLWRIRERARANT